MSNMVIVTDLDDGIFQIQLNDAVHDNRLSEVLLVEFLQVLNEVAQKPTLKILLLTGRKDVFCAGGPLDFLQKLATGQVHEKDLFELPNQMLSFPVPIVAALEGHAVGGGLMLALYCDTVVASESRRYGVNFTNMGFTPGVGTTSLLPMIVGHHFASEMILTAKAYKGRELKHRGLFNYIVPTAEVKPLALDLAQRMAEKPRHVLEMLKDSLTLPRRQALLAGMHQEHFMHHICFSKPETKAFIENSYIK